MFEVEAKVPIKRGEYVNLVKRLDLEGKYLGMVTKADIYYDNPMRAFIRIRRRGGENGFDIKKRRIRSGIESNIEMEWKINNLHQWKRLLGAIGIKAKARKQKKTRLYQMNDFKIELNEVAKLGYYLEIERLVDREDEILKAKKALEKIFAKLGYTKKQFEPRSYLELLSYV